MLKRTWLAGLLSGILILSGCQAAPAAEPKPEPKAAEPVKVAVLKGPTALGMLPMMDTGKLSDGTPLAVETLAAPDILAGKLLTGELDFATIPTNLAAKLYNKNGKYRLAAMNTWGAMYIVGTDSTVKTLEDLKGKTLYSTGKGTTPDILLRFALKTAGIDPAQVTVDYSLPAAELAQSVVAGKVTLALLPEPFVTQVTGKNPKTQVLLDVQKLYSEALKDDKAGIAQTCLVVRGDLVKSNPELVRTFIKDYQASLDSVNGDPKAAGELAVKHQLMANAGLAAKAIPKCSIRYQGAKEAREAIEGYLKVLESFSKEDIGGKLPDESFYLLKL